MQKREEINSGFWASYIFYHEEHEEHEGDTKHEGVTTKGSKL